MRQARISTSKPLLVTTAVGRASLGQRRWVFGMGLVNFHLFLGMQVSSHLRLVREQNVHPNHLPI
jgi:hypothetical protein